LPQRLIAAPEELMPMTPPTIAVIGCGGIGARHLQALGKLARDATIFAVDPSADALARSTQLFDEARQASASPARLVQFGTAGELPATIDIAIIATRAQHRLVAMQQLLAGRQVRHLVLEKFLFAKRQDFPVANALVAASGSRAWVNCPRRVYPGYRAIAAGLAGAHFVDIQVSGGARNAPIGTIGIHFADLLDHFGGAASPSRDARLQRPGLVEANRQLRDFSGLLEKRSGNATLRFAAIADTDAPHLVTIATDQARWIIHERDQIQQVAKAESGWKLETQRFEVPVQSALTNLIAESLLACDDCGLPGYARSAVVHADLLDTLLDAYRSLEGDPFLEQLPFT
jgi:predicted dehydrogenase